MAKPVSSLESHPQRHRIIEAIAANRPLTEVSAWTDPPVSRAALNRFKSRAIAEHNERIIAAKKAIANSDNELGRAEHGAVQRAALAVAVDPFLQSVMRQTERRGRWMRDIEEQGEVDPERGPDYKTLAVLDRNDQSGLELHAKLAGRLDAGANQVTVQVVFGAQGPAAPAEIEFDGVTLDIKA